MAEDARAGIQALRFGSPGAAKHECGGTVRDRRGIGRGDRAALAEGGFQLRDLFGARIAGLFVRRDGRLALAGFNGHGDDLGDESAAFDRRERIGQGAERVVVLLVPGELERLGAILGEGAHQAALVIGVLEAVEEHVVVGLLMSDPRAAPHGRKQVGRVRHAFHAAGDDHVGLPEGKAVPRDHRRLHPRAAHLVERRRGHVLAQTGEKPGLARGRLTLTGGKHAAHQDLVDIGGAGLRALERGGDRRPAQFGGRKRRQTPPESRPSASGRPLRSRRFP
jgi:hypothetical protein